ncbi:MAG: phosphate ABC transporter, permease protein PstA, partial [Alphaproteobacteria bacterium]|nr:phosphate ABC transporter, permease protein PstA [Alphaproteobacteria bacterium]
MARAANTPLAARGEPWLWLIGGALALGIAMILGFLALIVANGAAAFWPRPIELVTLVDGARFAGETARAEAGRRLYRVGNFDLYGDEFRWVREADIARIERPSDLLLIERLEWGVFIGRVVSPASSAGDLASAHAAARKRLAAIRALERGGLGRVNREMEEARLALRKVELASGKDSAAHRAAEDVHDRRLATARAEYDRLAAAIARLKAEDAKDGVVLADSAGREKRVPLSTLVRFHAPNAIGLGGKLAVYAARWWEFLSEEPREANTEGGVLPAIFGTVAMTLILAVIVAPFGVITALYLREYAKQGRLVSVVRVSVNNLAG